MSNVTQAVRNAWPKREAAARQADALFASYCAPRPARVPGMDTVLRLAVRIDCGRTIEEAAAREYLYRWSLALRSRVFGAPHTLGL